MSPKVENILVIVFGLISFYAGTCAIYVVALENGWPKDEAITAPIPWFIVWIFIAVYLVWDYFKLKAKYKHLNKAEHTQN